MRIEQLKYLVTVADTHSMTIASNMLYVSQQNISKSIISLEEELGEKLFERTSRGLFLTERGQDVYYYATQILEKIEDIVATSHGKMENTIQKTQKKKSQKRQQLSIDVTPGGGNLIRAPLLAIAKRFPNIIVDNVEHCAPYFLFSDGVMADLSVIQVDQGIVNGIYERFRDHEIIVLKREHLKVLAGRASPIANMNMVTLDKLRSVPFIVPNCQNVEYENMLLYHRLVNTTKNSIALRSNDNATKIAYAKNNLGCAFSNEVLFQELRLDKQVVLIPLKEKIKIYTLLIIKRESLLQEPVKFFKEYLLRKFALYEYIDVPY